MKKIFLATILLYSIAVAKYSKVRIYFPISEPEILAYIDIVKVKKDYFVEGIVNDYGLMKLSSKGINFEVLQEDLESYYAERMSKKTPFGAYYTYDEALNILDSLHKRFPNLCSKRIALPNNKSDTTWGGNKVWAIKVSDNVTIEEPEPEVLYTGVHHAREPITCNICVEWVRWLLENYGKNSLATYIVDNREIWVVPIVNPDGYKYNEKMYPGGGGMWRKNRRKNDGSYGVDNNRNYPYMWGYDDIGSSSDPHSETYRGPEPASEPETQSIINLCKKHQFRLALNYHSYTNLLLYPFGYEVIYTPDSLLYKTMAEDMTKENGYAIGTPWELLYLVNGGSDDWMYASPDKPKIFAFTPEVGEWFWQEDSVDIHIEETRPFNIYIALAAGKYLKLMEFDITTKDGDRWPEKGEDIKIIAKVKNISPHEEANNSSLNVKVVDEYITVLTPSINLGNIGKQKTKEVEILLRISQDCPQAHKAYIKLEMQSKTEKFPLDSIPILVGERLIVFKDDFEGGSFNWTGDWELTTEDFHSPSHSLTDSPKKNYPGESQLIENLKPEISLEESSYALLSLYTKYEIEDAWDFGYVEISRDGGIKWKILHRVTGTKDWHRLDIPLDDFAGLSGLKLRFRLKSDGSLHGDEWDGWYVDDVEITKVKREGVGIAERKKPRSERENSVKVYDVSGRLVQKFEKGSLNLQGLKNGVYFIIEGEESPRKVVICR